MNKICFVLDTHYPNYTNRLKRTSLKSFIDLELEKFGIHFFISTNRPDDFKEYISDNIHIFDIYELRKNNDISLKYEILPENPSGIYPSGFPWNLERFILKKAADMGFNYIINLDSDVVFDERYTGLEIKNLLENLFEENTICTNQAIFTYEVNSQSEIFYLHNKYKKHFNLNFETNQYNSLDGPVVIYMGKTTKDILRYYENWNMLSNFGYQKEFGYGYEGIVCGNWSLCIPMSDFKLKWVGVPFIPHHKYDDRY
jgi:hypothetical protein